MKRSSWLLISSIREIHPLEPQRHRHSMLAPRVCAPRVTRCSLGHVIWSVQLACSILSRSDSCQGDGRQRHLMMHGQCPIPVYSSQVVWTYNGVHKEMFVSEKSLELLPKNQWFSENYWGKNSRLMTLQWQFFSKNSKSVIHWHLFSKIQKQWFCGSHSVKSRNQWLRGRFLLKFQNQQFIGSFQ